MVFFSIAIRTVPKRALSSGFKRQPHGLRVPQRIYRNPEDYDIRSINRLILTLGLLVENAIRPFVIGRKNWLFSGSPRGAHASATIFSLIETAKANGLEPYRYLKYIFTKLPLAQSPDDYQKLIPQHLDRKEFDSFSS